MIASTLERLVAAGWSAGRRIDVAALAQRLQARGLLLHPAAAAFLERFGLLRVRGDSTHRRAQGTYFHTDPDDVVADPASLADCAQACGTRVCPIGATAYGEIVLVMDQHGRVFGLDCAYTITHWADSGDELLDLVLSHEGVPRPVDDDDRRPLDPGP